MKRTINANIAGQAFILDEDAYNSLEMYLFNIKSCLEAGENASESEEILADIESRISDLLNEHRTFRVQVINLSMVERTKALIGPASEFGTLPSGAPGTPGAEGNQANRKRLSERLYRDRQNKLIGGVCSGLGLYFNVDPTVVRIIALVAIILAGASVWIYLILWVVVPLSPTAIASK